MHHTCSRPLLALCLALLVGCTPSSAPDTGSAAFTVTSPPLLADAIARVTVTALAPDLAPVTRQLTLTGDVWSGQIDGLPLGPPHTFLAQGFDASGTLTMQRERADISLEADHPTPIALTLQPLTPRPPAFTSDNPVSLVARPGQALVLNATAQDVQDSPLTFAWSAALGTLGTPSHGATTSRVTWTAPACVPSDTRPLVSVRVTNGHALTAQHDIVMTDLPDCAPPSGWAATGGMAQAREGHTATLLADGRVLVVGGDSGAASPLATAELYDPATGTWSPTGRMHEARTLHPATRLTDGRVLVTGGHDTGARRLLATAELYDPATGTWSPTAAMSAVRLLHTATPLPDGRVLVTGMPGDLGIGPSAELYDPATGTWSPTANMTAPRYDHGAVLLPDGKVLVAGGTRDAASPLASAELYDPASNTWSPVASMAVPRYRAPATLLPGGRVLLSGGHLDSGPDAEVYDPAANTWSATGRTTGYRMQHRAVALSDGQVLEVAGTVTADAVSAERYDPGTGTWRAVPMGQSRGRPAVARLADGRVLVTGGTASGAYLSSAELYTP